MTYEDFSFVITCNSMEAQQKCYLLRKKWNASNFFAINYWIYFPNRRGIGISYKRKGHQHFYFFFFLFFPLLFLLSKQNILFGANYSACLHFDIWITIWIWKTTFSTKLLLHCLNKARRVEFQRWYLGSGRGILGEEFWVLACVWSGLFRWREWSEAIWISKSLALWLVKSPLHFRT